MTTCSNCKSKLEESQDITGYSIWHCPNSECEKSYKFARGHTHTWMTSVMSQYKFCGVCGKKELKDEYK